MIPMLLAARALPWRWIMPSIALLAVGVAFGWQVHQRHKAEDALSVAEARVAALEAAGRAQADRVASEQAVNDRAVARLLEEKNGELARIDADRVRLSDSLRDAYARTGSGAVREADAGAIADAVAARITGSAAEVDAALDAYDRACRRDAERLAFWVGYAAALGVQVSDGR